MSKAHAQKFMEHVTQDKALQKKIRTATNTVLDIAKSHGYKLSRKELNAELAKRWSPKRAKAGDDPDTCICFFSEPPSR